MNIAMIVGNLGSDPEAREVGDSTVCNFTVATNEFYGGEDHVEWHRVSIWGPQASACGEFLSKGSKVAVTGSVRTRSWEDKDGNTRYTTEIKANKVEFLSTKGEGATSTGKSSGRRGRAKTKRGSATDFPVA